MKLHIGTPTAIHQDWIRRMQTLPLTDQPRPTIIVPDVRLARWLSRYAPSGLDFVVIDQWLEQSLPQHTTRAPQGTWEFLTSLVPDTLLPGRYASVPGMIPTIADLVRRGRRIGVRAVVHSPTDQLPWSDLWNWYDRHLAAAVVDELGMYDYAVGTARCPSPKRDGPIFLYGFATIAPPLVQLVQCWHVKRPVEIWVLQGSPAADPEIWGDAAIKMDALVGRDRAVSALWIRPSSGTDLLDAAAAWVKTHDEHLRETVVVETDGISARAWRRALARHQLLSPTGLLYDHEEILWQLFVTILTNGTVRDAMVTRWIREAGPSVSVNWKTDWWQRALNIRQWGELGALVREAAARHNVDWAAVVNWAERIQAWEAFPGEPTASMVAMQLANFGMPRSFSEDVPILPLDLAVWVPAQHVLLAGATPGSWLRRITYTPFDRDAAIQSWVRLSDPVARDDFLVQQVLLDSGWSRWLVTEGAKPAIGDAVTVDAVGPSDNTTAFLVRAWYQAWRDTPEHSSYTGWVDASLVRSLMPSHLSPSALEDFGRCPLSFLLRRLLRIPVMEDEVVEVAPQTIGKWAHRALELMVRRRLRLTPARMRECVDQAIAENPLAATVPSFLRNYAADGLASELYEALVRDDWQPEGRTAVEVSLSWEWVWSMQGRVDRIDWMDDGSIRLVDYKTGTVANPAVPSPANLQLLLYQQALADRYGVAVNAEFYGISQKSRFMHRHVSHADGLARRPVIRSIADGMHARMQDGKFWPVPDPKIQPCRLCAYRLVCPERVVEYSGIKNIADAEFLALWAVDKDSSS